MHKLGLILCCLLAVGCIQNTYNITPEFHNSGSVNIDSRVDADDPRVTVTVDDVTMDWKELKEMVEKKMAAMPKDAPEKALLGAASAPAPAPAPASLPAPSVVSPPSPEPARMTHSVQVGAYRQLENAEQQVARLAAKGYPARMIRFEDSRKRTWYTVRIGDYSDATAARNAADEFTYRERLPSAVRPIGSL
jgi:cell division protein FtsN